MAPAISVIVPVFNTAKYLSMCLDSVLSQSMPDFEIIAVNDASTDNSLEILAGYAAKDPRVRIVNHEKNKGLLAARLTGIHAAKGKYTMFLDSDDCFLPGILRAVLDLAEKSGADIIDFILEVRLHSESGQEKKVKYFHPYSRSMLGKDVFRKYFAENVCQWSLCQKLIQTDLCRKTAEFIPDKFCLMAEDFCFFTICSFFARHYEPLKKTGYIYYVDSGISSFKKTEITRFMVHQSPFQAFRNVQDFLRSQNVWDEYSDAFAGKEQIILADYVFRWMHHLDSSDRFRAFNSTFSHYDALPLFLAFRHFFSDKDEQILEMLTGEDAGSPAEPPVMKKVGQHRSLREQQISAARWQEWVNLIRENHFDAVILEPDDDLERLLWDIAAVKSAGAAAVCRRFGHCFDSLGGNSLKQWLMEDRVIRQASAVLVPDEKSLAWYQSRNCYAGISLDSLQPPRCDPETSAMMPALEKSEQNDAYYRIDPSDDGETFVPFFRKLDHLFRKLPAGFRKTTFRGLAAIYNHIRRK